MQPTLNNINTNTESTIETDHVVKLYAFYIAESINLKILKADFTGKLLNSSSSELFYSVGDSGYIYIFNYGAVVF
ncbi:MAG: hypothetical protein HQK74_08900, partial [Desulfamplus sp.]|nr:hypothetical protein [Desulfamplus sp.]